MNFSKIKTDFFCIIPLRVSPLSDIFRRKIMVRASLINPPHHYYPKIIKSHWLNMLPCVYRVLKYRFFAISARFRSRSISTWLTLGSFRVTQGHIKRLDLGFGLEILMNEVYSSKCHEDECSKKEPQIIPRNFPISQSDLAIQIK